MRIGSLCTGYGGLDLAVAEAFGADLAWYAEIEPAACAVLEAHHPDLQNLGDVTRIQWEECEPVDILTAGYPCTPFSTAGLRKGTNDERHLWPYVRDAIRVLRPELVVLENVDSHRSLGFADVLADLASLGMSARWGVVRASDCGAPHHRARLFVAAYSARWTRGTWQGRGVPEPSRSAGLAAHDLAAAANAIGKRHDGGRVPAAKALAEVGRPDAARPADVDWREYGPAIARWEGIMGRSAPVPVVQGRRRMTLNPRFTEWLMGLPDGWVTGHGLTGPQELKLCGNGVVPRQALMALTLLGVTS